MIGVRCDAMTDEHLTRLAQNADQRVGTDVEQRLKLQRDMEDLIIAAWRAGHDIDEIAKAADLSLATARRMLADRDERDS